MRLEEIGFYTLSDARAAAASESSPLWRCELLLTSRCNFNCPYCRHVGDEISSDRAIRVIDQWADEDVRNIRLSGGEPTTWKDLVALVSYCRAMCPNLDRLAISTNGSADEDYYKTLVKAGVDDFSISLDACCSSTGSVMSGNAAAWEKVISNIRMLSEITYVTVGVVVTDENIDEVDGIINLAHSLGVSDIRVISAAQNSDVLSFGNVSDEILGFHPILKYRVNNFRNGRSIRGLGEDGPTRCGLVLDDIAVSGDYHYPCVIYLREGGDPIGHVSSNVRRDRLNWMLSHDCLQDPICKGNCLDVCVDYNRKYALSH